MSIVLPIFFLAVALGLFVRRMTPPLWAALIAFVLVILTKEFFKTH